MDEAQILEILKGTGAVITGSHIVYASGRQHGPAYVNKDAIFPHTRITSQLCRAIADHFWGNDVEVVAGPTQGGAIMAQWVAFWYYRYDYRPPSAPPLAVYAEEGGEKRVFHRGYDKLISGKRVLVVDDVLTTGGTVRKVVEAVRDLGGKVVGVGVIANRGKVTAQDVGDVPELFALVDVNMESFAPEECPLCRAGVPINTELGRGREFLAKLGQRR